jgi:hypothetical protein
MPNELQPQGVCELQGRRIEAPGLPALVDGFWPITHFDTPGGTFYANNVNFHRRDVEGGPSHVRRADSLTQAEIQ